MTSMRSVGRIPATYPAEGRVWHASIVTQRRRSFRELNGIVAEFSRTFMTDDINGVRVRFADEQRTVARLHVGVRAGTSVRLPATFRGLPVVVSAQQPAILAYARGS